MRLTVLTLAFLICVVGCKGGAKPSLIGHWECIYTGIIHSVETYSFKDDGTYNETSDLTADSPSYHFVTEHSGVYTFKDGLLTTTATGKMDSLNTDGSVKRHENFKPQTSSVKISGLTTIEFTLIPDDALGADAASTVFKKK